MPPKPALAEIRASRTTVGKGIRVFWEGGRAMLKVTSRLESERRRRGYSIVLWIAAGAGVVAGSLLIFAYVSQFGPHLSDTHDRWGQFGDYVGGLLNPVFGFAGFLILLHTLHEQKMQLRSERESQVLKDFESTFFQVLHRFDEVLGALEHEYSAQGSPAGVETSRQALRLIYKTALKNKYSDAQDAKRSGLETAIVLDQNMYKNHTHIFGIYFRSLYHVFKFIDTSDLRFEQKVRYANLTRAQLSSYELALLFYNGLWGEGQKGFRPLIEKYGLLKHLDGRTLLAPEHLTDSSTYSETARMNFQSRLKAFNGLEPEIPYD
jgi:hypothetical protein